MAKGGQADGLAYVGLGPVGRDVQAEDVSVPFPVLVLGPVNVIGDRPVIVPVSPDVEVIRRIAAEVTAVRDVSRKGRCRGGDGRFQIGQVLLPGSDGCIPVRALVPGHLDPVDGALPILRHIECEGPGRCPGSPVEFLLVPVFFTDRIPEGAERPVEVAYPDLPDDRPVPVAGQMGRHLGQQALHRDGVSLARPGQFPGHGQAAGGECPRPFRIGRNSIGKIT